VLPSTDVRVGEDIIGIACGFLTNIDNYQRQDHFIERDLIDSVQALVEMRRGIDVSSPLADVAVALRLGAVLLIGEEVFAGFVRKTLPMRDAGLD
jgi:hypothetical protein